MVAITPGTSGTFQAATAEGRALEILAFIQLNENLAANNPDNRNNVTAAIDTDELLLSGTFSIPATQAITPDGTLTITASAYLVNAAILPGSNSPTFKSTLPERYLLEVLMFIQGLERVAARNPQSRNGVTGNYNSDTGLYQGSFNLPVTLALVAGKLEIQATEYLTNS